MHFYFTDIMNTLKVDDTDVPLKIKEEISDKKGQIEQTPECAFPIPHFMGVKTKAMEETLHDQHAYIVRPWPEEDAETNVSKGVDIKVNVRVKTEDHVKQEG